ncbi:tetratricopeptide repeat protein [Psychroserpens algicola]|uniref:Tetratricopeptide repeat protein n=1 Tax=Psychroserpens algicola TaxID=1719034 RepID=A0ABT0H6A7_9FLAO|nr:tetratricopeptide repeat protein [Psychroserpens algicola]MCK8479335.1 tetratricopeptide repeat protein [Psychroserpens algicola]
MKTLRSLILASFLLLVVTSNAQNMQEGFNHLETGEYALAETFFDTVLKSYPKNKTARLCYGRAVGLNGDPEKANHIFLELLKEYPTDFEVKLNYGESLLWKNEFNDAKSYYEALVFEAPKSFPALLGLANTLSNLKDYNNALIYVNKALEVSPGNPNALISKKYIYLGFAYQKQLAQLYDEAEILLIKNLELFGEDKETLMNLANLYLINNQLDFAKGTYKRLAENPLHTIEALNGLALVAHLNGKEKHALQLSHDAYTSIDTKTSEILIQQTTERYIQALIWNKKYKQAEHSIDELIANSPNANWVLALRATLNIYKSNFKKSLSDYNRILENDSTSFDGNLGKANALKALGYYDDAYISAENTLKFYDNQKDALNFINILNTSFIPVSDSKAAYTFDNGNNRAFTFNTNVSFPLSTKFKLLGRYNYRTTNNSVTNNEANSNDISLGLSYQLINNITFNGTTGLTTANTESNNYTQLLTDVSFNIKPLKLQTLDIGYKRDIQSFNADLLDREIAQNNYYANYNLNTNFNLGWFTQFMHTSQNDGNKRNLLFTSLYYNLFSKPSLKMGLNYQYITFADQVPTVYFSPESFQAGEVFLNLIKDENITKSKQWFYELTAATGFQFIEDGERQSTYRVQGKIGYKFSELCMANVFGTRSNIASATAAGFTFTEIGLRFKWHLFDAPVFRK